MQETDAGANRQRNADGNARSLRRPPTNDTNRQVDFIPAPLVRTLLLQEIGGERFAATRLRSSTALGMTADHVQEDAFQLSLQLRDYSGFLWHQGRKLSPLIQAAGTIATYDYRDIWRADLAAGFDCVNYHLPRPALESLTRDRGGRNLDTLSLPPGEVSSDPVIAALTASLMPAFECPDETSALFRDHVGWSIAAHVVTRYGGLSDDSLKPGALGQWRERRVKELIDANLGGNLSLADIAEDCGISVSHLIRGFKRANGVPPHQWLLQRRVELAKTLLLDPRTPVAVIAVACGFADQSHLTRVFARLAGAPPGAWRRANS